MIQAVLLNCGPSMWDWITGTEGSRVGWSEPHKGYWKWLIKRSKK